ncbi:MAG: MotA/TolQ/ExbB proton channel family protein, partial [Planctomycetota bacterium]|nr:MotA/TolQ/ExbB proton channel family protein [Planctomycetota bacterium]
DSVYDMLVNGGPLMVPIALCSIVAVAYTVERSMRLRNPLLGSEKLGREILAAVESSGPSKGLELCKERDNPLTRILGAGLSRFGAPFLEVEKAVEDAGEREVRRLSARLRPLVVVGMIAPLLGLLGTVWGMIEAFSSIALKGGLGKPELLASGISQALITTAAGLAIAIPAQAVYFYFRGRIDRFVNRTEDLYLELDQQLERHRVRQLEPATGGSPA